MEKYRVTLVPEERAALERLVSRGKSASRKLTHARILLLADGVGCAGHGDDEMVDSSGYQFEDHRSRPETICRRRNGGGDRSQTATAGLRSLHPRLGGSALPSCD